MTREELAAHIERQIEEAAEMGEPPSFAFENRADADKLLALLRGTIRPEALEANDGGITQALVEMARENAIEECARIADKHRGRFYEHDKSGADIGGEIRALKSAAPQGLPAVNSASRQALASGPKTAESPDGRPTGASSGMPDPVRDSAKQPAVAAPDDPGWINIGERLPEGDASVFASGISGSTGGQWREVVSSGWIRRNPGLVTHWMPLPEKPRLPQKQEF